LGGKYVDQVCQERSARVGRRGNKGNRGERVEEGGQKFETLIFQFVNETMSKGRDSALTNSMFAAMATGGQPAAQAQNLGAGYLFWTEDRTGDVADVALQARFDAMPATEQNCADWLQTLTRELHLYLVEHIIDARMRSALLAELAKKRALNQVFMWKYAKTLIQAQLRDFDVKFLTDAVQSMLRDENSTLREWVQMFIRLQEMCTNKGVTYPAAHWAKQLLGQVASNEKTDGKFQTLSKDESAYGAFVMDNFEKEVLDLAQGTLPVFKQTNVRARVATLLVDPNRVLPHAYL